MTTQAKKVSFDLETKTCTMVTERQAIGWIIGAKVEIQKNDDVPEPYIIAALDEVNGDYVYTLELDNTNGNH